MTSVECRQLCRDMGCALVLISAPQITTPDALTPAREWCDDVFTTPSLNDLLPTLQSLATQGFHYALTLPTSSSISLSAIATILSAAQENKDALIIGADEDHNHRTAHILFLIESLVSIPDPNSALRLYPLHYLQDLKLYASAEVSDTELLVRLAWRGVTIVSVPVACCESHPLLIRSVFGPLRVALLHVFFILAALLWFYPLSLYRWLRAGKLRGFLDAHLFHSGESAARLASAVAVGVMVGVWPIWGFQTVTALALAQLLRLNKIVVVTFSNVSLPPVIPFIVFSGLHLGGWVFGVPVSLSLDDASVESIGSQMLMYVVGSALLGILLALVIWPLTWIIITLARRK